VCCDGRGEGEELWVEGGGCRVHHTSNGKVLFFPG
jgi:hypothetical protein